MNAALMLCRMTVRLAATRWVREGVMDNARNDFGVALLATQSGAFATLAGSALTEASPVPTVRFIGSHWNCSRELQDMTAVHAFTQWIEGSRDACAEPPPSVTLSPTLLTQTPETPVTTNAEFLTAVFADLEGEERPMVTEIVGPITKKTTWHALPWSQDINVDNPEANWYFTLSTFLPEGQAYARRKANFCRAFGLYLDDVGTKIDAARLEACPPSYLIETSPGNFQAGYLFDKPCADLARLEALQKALIAARLCDPGADGPSARNGRLPFAINGKYDPPPACRLVEWHPQRRYSLEQIAQRFELEPVRSKGLRKQRVQREDHGVEGDVYVPRPAENAVLKALRQRGLYKRPLGDGRHDISCPWVHEHTEQLDAGTAYFEPSDLYPFGGFKCQHGHCAGRRIAALLEHLAVSFTDAKHKPTLRVQPGELHRVVDAAERVLAGGGRHYQRGGLIVSVVTDPGTDETRIKPVSVNALTRALSAGATWEQYDRRCEAYVVTDPPTRYVNVLYDADRYEHLPVLHGIARQPYLRRDGSLMATSGFDGASGMFGAFDERAFLIPARPTRQDAEQALAELSALLGEFAFQSTHDRAAALALILTAAIRPTLATAPMGHIKAPQIASGKSYLQALIAAFGSPCTPSAYAFPSTEEECAKLLLSALLEAPAVVIFDNLTSDLLPFKSLCSALTEEHLTGRVLGVSKTATVPTATLFLSSGNNVDPVQDMARRVMTVTLDPACETPATRTFHHDPLAAVRADRERFVSLAITVIRAYVEADCTAVADQEGKPLKPLASYGDWSRLVRAPLVWLGLPDPATSVFTRLAEDPDREVLGRLLSVWHRKYGTAATTVRQVVEAVESMGAASLNPALVDVVREIADERGVINRKRFGRWIARHQGRIVSGQRFERCAEKRNGSEQWKVVSVDLGVSAD